jgi:ribosomal protein S18 acetylase RimI-like enzyme
MLSVEVLHEYSEDTLNDVLHIERASFPSEWQFEDTKADYKEKLMDEDNISVFLKSNGEKIGYLLAILHNKAVESLKDADPEIKEDSKRFYIYTVGIVPQYRHRGGFSEMLRAFIEESNKRGISQVSLHARVENGLSKTIQRKLKVTLIRRIDAWRYYGYQEPTDYIEASLQ